MTMHIMEPNKHYPPSRRHHHDQCSCHSKTRTDERIKYKTSQRRSRRNEYCTSIPILFILSFMMANRDVVLLASSMLLRLPTVPIASSRHNYHYCNVICNNNNPKQRKMTIVYSSNSDPSPAGKYLNLLSTNIASNDGDDTDDDDDDDNYADSIPMPVRSAAEPSEESSLDNAGRNSNDGIDIIEAMAKKMDATMSIPPSSSTIIAGKSMSVNLTANGAATRSPSIVNNGEENKATVDGIINDGEEHPNEEPPGPTDEEYEDTMLPSTIYEDAVKSSKFDSVETDAKIITAGSTKSKSKSPSKEEKNSEHHESNDDTKSNHPNAGIKAMLKHLLGGNNDANKSQEETETERARKWSEWMSTGRKSRSKTTSASSSDVAIDESLLSVDKGADYVIVAVPAEAADGVGPILSSFPGGKLFQKTIGKTFQDVIVNGADGAGSGSGNSNNHKNATSTSAVAISHGFEKKTKKRQQQSTTKQQSRSKKKQTKKNRGAAKEGKYGKEAKTTRATAQSITGRARAGPCICGRLAT
mmetsp:Transcript_18040/g.38987  ORF Transcript_18040/g.38987 Transcript_18040/m.38987 type:complete len:528 (-) Transcript_18040:1359-2942(-)